MAVFELTISNSDRMADLVEYLDYLIIERCNELTSKIIEQDAEYQKLQSEMKQCFQKIEDLLPETESKETIMESLWVIIGTLEILLPRLAYKQCLKDVVRLRVLLEM